MNIIKRELRQIFIKDPRIAGIIFAASIAYLVIFALLYGTHVVNGVPLAICDEDQTRTSRALVQAFADAEKFRLVAQPDSADELRRLLDERAVYAAVHIQRGFAWEIAAGRSSPLLFLAGGANLVVTNAATTAAQEIVASFGQSLAAGLAEKAGLPSDPAAARTVPAYVVLRVHNNPTFSYLNFFVIGLAMAAFQQGVFLPVGASIIREYQALAELAAYPAAKVIALKLLPYFLLDTLSFFVTLLVSVKIFAIPCKAGLPSLFLLATAFTFTAIALASLAASFCRDEITFTKLCLIYAVPAFTLSGSSAACRHGHIQPDDRLSLPLFYLADALRDLLLSGYSPLLVRNILVLYILGAILIGLTVRGVAARCHEALRRRTPAAAACRQHRGNRMHRIVNCCSLAALVIAVALPPSSRRCRLRRPEKFTLADSIALALANNPAVKLAQAEQDKALWQVNQARTRYGPTLSYNFARARTDEPPSWYNNTTTDYPVSFYPLSTRRIEYPAWTKTYDVYRHQLQLIYPLYTGGRMTAPSSWPSTARPPSTTPRPPSASSSPSTSPPPTSAFCKPATSPTSPLRAWTTSPPTSATSRTTTTPAPSPCPTSSRPKSASPTPATTSSKPATPTNSPATSSTKSSASPCKTPPISPTTSTTSPTGNRSTNA
jgi:ABC-2 type transport system permease protein